MVYLILTIFVLHLDLFELETSVSQVSLLLCGESLCVQAGHVCFPTPNKSLSSAAEKHGFQLPLHINKDFVK